MMDFHGGSGISPSLGTLLQRFVGRTNPPSADMPVTAQEAAALGIPTAPTRPRADYLGSNVGAAKALIASTAQRMAQPMPHPGQMMPGGMPMMAGAGMANGGSAHSGMERLSLAHMRMPMADGGMAMGAGDGRSDSMPMMMDDGGIGAISDGEYVVPADAVSAMGRGSSAAGAKRLDAAVERARATHARRMERLPKPQRGGSRKFLGGLLDDKVKTKLIQTGLAKDAGGASSNVLAQLQKRGVKQDVAGFTPDQLEYFSRERGLANDPTGYRAALQKGQDLQSSVFSSADPYSDKLIDASLADYDRGTAINAAAAARSGAGRHAFGDGSQLAANEAAQEAARGRGLLGEQLREQGLARRTAAATSIADLAQREREGAIGDTSLLGGIGDIQQQQAQRVADAPINRLKLFSGIASGQPSTTQTNTSTSPLKLALGLGATAAGAFATGGASLLGPSASSLFAEGVKDGGMIRAGGRASHRKRAMVMPGYADGGMVDLRAMDPAYSASGDVRSGGFVDQHGNVGEVADTLGGSDYDYTDAPPMMRQLSGTDAEAMPQYRRFVGSGPTMDFSRPAPKRKAAKGKKKRYANGGMVSMGAKAAPGMEWNATGKGKPGMVMVTMPAKAAPGMRWVPGWAKGGLVSCMPGMKHGGRGYAGGGQVYIDPARYLDPLYEEPGPPSPRFADRPNAMGPIRDEGPRTVMAAPRMPFRAEGSPTVMAAPPAYAPGGGEPHNFAASMRHPGQPRSRFGDLVSQAESYLPSMNNVMDWWENLDKPATGGAPGSHAALAEASLPPKTLADRVRELVPGGPSTPAAPDAGPTGAMPAMGPTAPMPQARRRRGGPAAPLPPALAARPLEGRPAMLSSAEPTGMSHAFQPMPPGTPGNAQARGGAPGPEADKGSFTDRFLDNPLTQFGLGILASRNPSVGGAIGEAGLGVIQNRAAQRQQERQDRALAQQQQRLDAADKRAEQTDMLAIAGLGLRQDQAQSLMEDRKAQRAESDARLALEARKAEADMGYHQARLGQLSQALALRGKKGPGRGRAEYDPNRVLRESYDRAIVKAQDANIPEDVSRLQALRDKVPAPPSGAFDDATPDAPAGFELMDEE